MWQRMIRAFPLRQPEGPRFHERGEISRAVDTASVDLREILRSA